MVLSRVNRSAAIIALVGVRGTGKTTICGQIMIKLARRWSELVQCELVGFVLLVQHQRTYASQLMSDSHEPDVVLCAEVRIDRLQRFNDFNQLEIDPRVQQVARPFFPTEIRVSRARSPLRDEARTIDQTPVVRLLRRLFFDTAELRRVKAAPAQDRRYVGPQCPRAKSRPEKVRRAALCPAPERAPPSRVARRSKNGAGSPTQRAEFHSSQRSVETSRPAADSPRRLRYRGVGAEPSFARSKSLTSTARLFGTMPEPNLRA